MRRWLPAAAVLAASLLLTTDGPALAGPSSSSSPRSALIVGVSRHAGGRPASPIGGAGDAVVMREMFRRAGWRDDEVRVLTDTGATAANIRAGLQWLKDRSGPNSFSAFHYSGHVYQRPGDIDRDGEVLDEFLVPYDSRNIISDAELGQRLGSVQGWLWTNISGCEAAGFNEGGLFGERRLFTGSSYEHQKSYEMPGWRQSIFTGLLADQAVLQGRGDANRDGLVSIQEAFRFAEREAPVMTARQRKGVQQPVMFGGGGSPEWFLNPPATPAATPAETARAEQVAPARPKLCVPILNICL